jgi:DNA-binding XRE family transcriptional regulator
VEGLLKAVGINPETDRPSRVRARFEKALETLEADGVIKAWQYENWKETYQGSRGWLRLWLSSSVIIEPPDVVGQTYSSFASSVRSSKSEIAQRIQSARRCMGASILFAAEQIGVNPEALSAIECGKTKASRSIRKKIEAWLERVDLPSGE